MTENHYIVIYLLYHQLINYTWLFYFLQHRPTLNTLFVMSCDVMWSRLRTSRSCTHTTVPTTPSKGANKKSLMSIHFSDVIVVLPNTILQQLQLYLVRIYDDFPSTLIILSSPIPLTLLSFWIKWQTSTNFTICHFVLIQFC